MQAVYSKTSSILELRLYNTMTRNIETLNPLNGGEVKMYCCGPTVYNFQHIGNLRTYIFEDILARVIRYAGYKLTHVMNITDVGHLASDADEGEDKMLLAEKREGKKSHEIANFYTDIFFNDCSQLNIIRPDIVCKATEHIKQMIELIERLINRGFAYLSNGNVYFDVSKYDEYGKLSGQSLESLKAGARIDIDSSKKNPLDFVLWFTKSKFENQELLWDSPWGKGYPGWHIECSAMAMEYLGESFDIHCGGIDHIPVHHTNEIAQSECATGKNFASIWMHGGFLVENSGEKMSKSKGDFLTLERIKEKGFNALSYRYLCLTSVYRSELSWSWKSLEGAESSYKKLKKRCDEIRDNKTIQDLSKLSNPALNFKREFEKSALNDLNMPQSLSKVYGLISDKNISNDEKTALIKEFDKILGLNLLSLEEKDIPPSLIPSEIIELSKKRDEAKAKKDFKTADELRDKIQKAGYVIKDTAKGAIIEKSDS